MTSSALFTRVAAAAVSAALLFGPAPPASAQQLPPYAQQLPPYARPAGEEIGGTISSIDSVYRLTLHDTRGYLDNVALHQGTIILPTGLTLEPGMSVTIRGFVRGNAFVADEIDTAYAYSGPPPVAVYYGSGCWYPGYAYGWGPSFLLVFSSRGELERERWRCDWYGWYHDHGWWHDHDRWDRDDGEWYDGSGDRGYHGGAPRAGRPESGPPGPQQPPRSGQPRSGQPRSQPPRSAHPIVRSPHGGSSHGGHPGGNGQVPGGGRP